MQQDRITEKVGVSEAEFDELRERVKELEARFEELNNRLFDQSERLIEHRTIDPNLTRDSILAMGAGRTLDALVAIHVFGRPDVGLAPDGGFFWDARNPIPREYSTDIAAAWQILANVDFQIWSCDMGYGCRVYLNDEDCVQAFADTAPLAICRAALLSKVRD